MNASTIGLLASALLHAVALLWLVASYTVQPEEEPRIELLEINLSLFQADKSPVDSMENLTAAAPTERAADSPVDPPTENINSAEPIAQPEPITAVELPEPSVQPSEAEPEAQAVVQQVIEVVEESPADDPAVTEPEIVVEQQYEEVSFVESTVVLEQPDDPELVTKEDLPLTKEPQKLQPTEIAAVSASTTKSVQETNYSGKVRAAVVAQRVYPRQARRRNITGEVLVGFTLKRSGQLQAAYVVRSSGFDTLDKAALAAVKKVRSFEAFPQQIEKSVWDFEVALVFR